MFANLYNIPCRPFKRRILGKFLTLFMEKNEKGFCFYALESLYPWQRSRN